MSVESEINTLISNQMQGLAIQVNDNSSAVDALLDAVQVLDGRIEALESGAPPVEPPPVEPPPSAAYPSSVTYGSYTPAPTMSMPSVGIPSDYAGLDTQVARTSSVSGTRHYYASKAAWNIDQTYLVLDGATPRMLLDGGDMSVIQSSVDTTGTFTWSNVDPNRAYGTSGLSIYRLSVTDAGISIAETLATLTQYSYLRIGGGQVSQDNADKYLPINWKKADGSAGIALFNLTTKTVTGELTLVTTATIGTGIDNVGLSQDGNFVYVLMEKPSGANTSSTSDKSLSCWVYPVGPGGTLSSASGWSTAVPESHWDAGVDADGNQVIVQANSWRIQMRRFDHVGGWVNLRSGTTGAMHISCRNVLRPGWAYISNFEYGTGYGGAAEVYAIKLDTSQTVERFAYTHQATSGSGYLPYDDNPMACASPDGSRVIFASRWQNTGDGNRYAFVAGVDAIR